MTTENKTTIETNEQSKIDTSAMLNIDLVADETQFSDAQKKELEALYEEAAPAFEPGKIIEGTIIARDGDGVSIDVGYKSNGFIPLHEFTDIERKKLAEGNTLEVVIDQLEDDYGSVVLSYQKAKACKAWEKIAELAKTDEPVTGVVTHKVKGGLSVDIGISAFLPGSQVDIQRVTNFDQYVGQEITGKILKVNKRRGNVIISRRKYLEEQRQEDRKQALDTIEEGQVVQGIVKNITNYGVFVDIGGIDGLLHITDMSWGRISHPSELVQIGDSISVKVLSFDKEREKISLGMKQLVDNPWDTIEDKYAVGSKVTGRISSITDYGLFVEVEKGIEGLVHISEISWTDRISNLSKHFAVGQEIETVIVALDKENRRMSLSIKQLKEDPWKNIVERFKVGEKVTGIISNVTDFGVFVQLEEGIDGLIHVSDLSWVDHITHPGDNFKKGESIEAIILSVDPENRKISLGVKQLERNPWDTIEAEYQPGKVVEGTVSKITNFGAFVRLENGIEGLVHISELSGKDVQKIEDVIKVGEKYSFKVLKVNKDERKLGLSLKALEKGAQSSSSTPSVTPKEPSKEKESRAPRKSHTAKSNVNTSPLAQALAEHAAKIKEQESSDEPKADDNTSDKPSE